MKGESFYAKPTIGCRDFIHLIDKFNDVIRCVDWELTFYFAASADSVELITVHTLCMHSFIIKKLFSNRNYFQNTWNKFNVPQNSFVNWISLLRTFHKCINCKTFTMSQDTFGKVLNSSTGGKKNISATLNLYTRNSYGI